MASVKPPDHSAASDAGSCVLAAPSDAGWTPGFYRLQAQLRADEGASPLLRVATGRDAHGRLEWRPLAPADVQGRLRSVFVVGRSIDRLEIQADEGGPPPALSDIQVQPIGRRQALAHMLGDLRQDGEALRWWTAPMAVLRALLTAARFGARAAGNEVLHRYLGGLRAARAPKVRVWPHLWHRIDAELTPVNDLVPAPDHEGATVWVACGDDPQFQLTQAGGACTLPAGWYRLSLCLETMSGRVSVPRLYPDFGSQVPQDTAIHLPEPDRQGLMQTLLMFRAPVVRLRLDPSFYEATFRIRDVQLRRVGRLRAFLSMLSILRLPEGRLDLKAVASTCLSFARTWWKSGVSEAGVRLFRTYQDLRSPSSYSEWIRHYDSHPPSLAPERAHAGPLVSVLVPVYQTPEHWLRRCIDSVLQQSYQNWELCIADDASPDARVREVLQAYEKRDPRIRVSYRAENGHISEASNTALAMARGEYVALLDHDDELRPHALAEMVEAIGTHPRARLLYSDEDKIDEDGRRFHPYFKPDWNPDLLRSQNYICHFTLLHTALAREVGGFRRGFEGSQDHDLFLRCVERLEAGEIHHVPKVLYHWRAIEGSTAHTRQAKDYAGHAGLRAVAEHLERIGSGASVQMLEHGHYRVRWAVPVPAPRVSLIIPTRDRVELLRTCVESLLERTDYPSFELVVVDNQSSEPAALEYLASLRDRPRVRVLSFDAPFNYSAINNWAAAQCDAQVLGLLNNDIEVIDADWLQEMVGHAMRPDVGAVGAMLYYPDDTIQHAGVLLGLGGVANHAYAGQPRGYPGHGARALVTQNLSSVTAACLVLRREVYEAVGGLDERLQVAFNDVDLCLRLCEAGYRNVWTPFAQLYHHESASRGRDDSPEKRKRFVGEVRYMEARWGELLHRDPAYNPNLSLDSVNSDFAFPPRGM